MSKFECRNRVMKNAKSFVDYYRSLDKKFGDHFRNSLRQDEAENIHQLRVIIKKIKAFFHMLNYLDDDFNFGKLFREFENIFKEAGKIRDVQVRIFLFDSIEKEISVPLINQRRRSEKDEKIKFISYKKNVKKKPGFHAKVKKKITRLLKKDFTFASIKLYLISQSEEITERMNKHHFSYRELHKLRIHLKRYYYNIFLLNDCLLKNKLIAKHIDRLNKLQDQLGNLHDSVSVFGLTKKFRAGRDFSIAEMKSIRLLNVRLERSNEKRAVEIRRHFLPLLTEFGIIKKKLLESKKNGLK
jgi:CHAD domain-containing protein